jgi:hypothetical protein
VRNRASRHLGARALVPEPNDFPAGERRGVSLVHVMDCVPRLELTHVAQPASDVGQPRKPDVEQVELPQNGRAEEVREGELVAA